MQKDRGVWWQLEWVYTFDYDELARSLCNKERDDTKLTAQLVFYGTRQYGKHKTDKDGWGYVAGPLIRNGGFVTPTGQAGFNQYFDERNKALKKLGNTP